MTDQPAPPPPPEGEREGERDELRLTPSQWHTLLEKPSFLERDDNHAAPPRRFRGRPVRIVPDDSWR